MIFIQRIGFFIVTHLETLLNNAISGNTHYVEMVLTRLEELDIREEDYTKKRDRILVDSSVALDIDFTLYFQTDSQNLSIKPAPMDIYRDIMYQIRNFITKMEKVDFRIVRT